MMGVCRHAAHTEQQKRFKASHVLVRMPHIRRRERAAAAVAADQRVAPAAQRLDIRVVKIYVRDGRKQAVYHKIIRFGVVRFSLRSAGKLY